MSISPQRVNLLSPELIDILDLRHFSARQLRPLLTEESALWEQRLLWDYGSSIELLLQYLDSRILPGFVATVRGRVCGYAFWVLEANKAVIGDVYVLRDAGDVKGLRNLLVLHLLETLTATPGVDRVESQLLLYDAGTLSDPFEHDGFRHFRRLYQECSLDFVADSHAPGAVPSGFEVRPWIASAYQPVAELIHAAYAGHLDAQINDQYRSLHGTLRFLHNIIRFPGCGTFDPEGSLLVRDCRTDKLAGVLLSSRIAPTVSHLTQLCVSPEYRGLGLGRTMLKSAFRQLAGRGYRTVTLTVSEANRPATKLYEQFGFTTRHRFDAMVRERAGTPSHVLGGEDSTGFSDDPAPGSGARRQAR